MVKFGIVDGIVSIGAIPYQDFYQAQGYSHYKTSPRVDDLALRELFVDRIYDTLVDEDKFRETDAVIGNIAEKLEPRGYSSREFMEILGDHVKDKNSILYNCRKYGVPMFVPALNDSSIGIGLTGLYQRARAAKKPFMHMDPIRDNWELTQMKIKAEKTGVIYIGGGVPKNFIQQTEVIAETLGLRQRRPPLRHPDHHGRTPVGRTCPAAPSRRRSPGARSTGTRTSLSPTSRHRSDFPCSSATSCSPGPGRAGSG